MSFLIKLILISVTSFLLLKLDKINISTIYKLISRVILNNSACDKIEKNEKYRGDNMKIAIIGAGIGGLTAAALLQEQGHTIKVFEKMTLLMK